MQPRDADIEVARHARAHHLRDDRRLLRDGDVGRAGRDDGDVARLRAWVRVEPGEPCVLVVCRAGQRARERGRMVRPDARHEHAAAAVEHLAGDGGDLRRRLADREDDLREAVPEIAMVVDVGEAEVGEWRRFELRRGLIDGHAAIGDRREQGAQFCVVHESECSALLPTAPGVGWLAPVPHDRPMRNAPDDYQPPRAVVFANGDLPSAGLVRSIAAGADILVAADGGVNKALSVGIEVAAVVGDLDSVTPESRARIPADRFHQDRDINSTDLQKALAFCLARGYTRIDVLAAGGGRADHAFANLSVVTLLRGIADVRLQDDLFEVRLVDGAVAFEGAPGRVVSLVAIGQCEGVTTTGLRWNLDRYPLAFSPYGVHNETLGGPATVAVESGDLLLFLGRWTENHGAGTSVVAPGSDAGVNRS